MQGQHLIQLQSSVGFLDLFTMRQVKRTDIRIPNTLLCHDGEWKEWMFNSEKERTHIILKKKKQNLLTYKVVRFLCYTLGVFEHIKEILAIEEIYERLQGELRPMINQEDKTLVIYKSSKQPKLLRTLDLIKTLTNRSYADKRCPEGWVVVQEVIQFSPRHEEYYYVSAQRPTDIANYRFNFLKRTVNEEDLRLDEENVFNVERKDIVKTLDQGITHRQLTLTLKLVDFFQTHLKFQIKRIDLKMSVNRSRQPFLLAILKLTVVVPTKLLDAGTIKPNQTVDVHNYLTMLQNMKSLPDPVKRIPTEQSKKSVTSQNCMGDLCHLPLKSEAKNTNQYSEVPQELIARTRNNIHPIMNRLKEMNLIQANAEDPIMKKNKSDSDIESDDELDRMGYMRKVCKKCHFLYGIINKTVDFDTRGQIVQHHQNILSANAIAAISEGMNFQKRPSRPVVKKEVPHNTSTSSKNFLKLNMEVLKNGLPSITKRRPLSASIKESELSISQKRIEPEKPKIEPVKPKIEPVKALRFEKQIFVKPTKPVRQKAQSLQTLPLISKEPALKNQSKKAVDYSLQAAKNKLMTTLSWVSAHSINQLKEKYHDCYKGFKNRQNFQVHPIEYLANESRHPLDRRHIYTFQNNTLLHPPTNKYNVIVRPTMTLQKLSDMTGYPQIIMKNNFIVETLICDEKTTITYCILTSDMFGNEPGRQPYQNIVFFQDMFDCFLQWLQTSKDILQNSINKRIILFNYPGQSYTTFNQNVHYDAVYLTETIDKLLYRLSEQRHLININQDEFKFIGVGYGGYLLQLYTCQIHEHMENLKKIMLINSFSRISKSQEKILLKLIDIYSSKDKVLEEHAHLYYNLAVNSTQQSNQVIDSKVVLNPITVRGRAFLLENIMQSTYPIARKFEEVAIPTTLLYGKDNMYIGKHEMHILAHYIETPTQKMPNRQLFEISSSGHCMLDDNPLELLKYLEQFIQS